MLDHGGFTMNMQSEKNKYKHLVHIALFSAIGFLLMFIEMSVPFVPSFLKFDISELPALLMSFIYGPISGVVVCLLKNALHLTITTTGGVGELSNFLLGAIFCLVAGYIYKFKRTKTGAIVGMLVGAAVMGGVCFFTNLFIMYPFYYNVIPKQAILGMCQAILPSVDSIEKSLLIFNVPFTFVKGVICSVITFIAYKKLKKVLKIENKKEH